MKLNQLPKKAGNLLAGVLVLGAALFFILAAGKFGLLDTAPSAEAIDPRAEIAAEIEEQKRQFAIAQHELDVANAKAEAAQKEKEAKQAAADALRAKDKAIVIESTPVDFTQPQPDQDGALLNQ